VPQILQRNFPESENVKCGPPVTIVNDLDRHFFVARARGDVFHHGALLRKICVSGGVRHKRGARIGDDFEQAFLIGEVDRANRGGVVAQQIDRLEDAPVNDIDVGGPQGFKASLQRINRVGPTNIGTVAYQLPIIFVGDREICGAQHDGDGNGDPSPRNRR
jgi:hypothetical protein